MTRQQASNIDLSLCLGATSTETLAARTRIQRRSEKLDRKDEVCANVIFRMLFLRGLLNQDHTHTPWATALYNTIKGARANDKFQEPLYLAVELLRANLLNDAPLSIEFSGGPSFGDDEEQKAMLLIIRTISILPMNFKHQQYSGPLSRELLAFNSFTKAMSQSLRHLLENISMQMLLRGDARRAREDYLDIALSLPFQQCTNTAFGIFFKVYLDALSTFAEGRVTPDPSLDANEENDRISNAKKQAMELLEDIFPNVINHELEVARGFRFWKAVVAIVHEASAHKQLCPELARSFKAAELWLTPMTPPSKKL